MKLKIRGKKHIEGNVQISGAKNSAVAIIPAATLTDEPITLYNIPDISDVRIQIDILNNHGYEAIFSDNTLKIQRNKTIKKINTNFNDNVESLRGSYYFIGSYLSRYKKIRIKSIGGCNLGPRPINYHLDAFKLMNAQYKITNDYIEITTRKLKGTTIYLEYPSVGTTINIIIASILAKGTTIIKNGIIISNIKIIDKMNKNKTNWVAVLTMMFLFGMIAFVTNLAAPIGVIWKQQPGIDGSGFWGMMGNMMNFLAYLFMGLPAGKLITRLGYKKTTLIGVGVGFVGVLIQYLSGKLGVGASLAGLPANFFVYLLGAFVSGFCVCILNVVVNPMLNLLGGGGNRGNQLVQIGGSFNSLVGTLTPMLVGALIGSVTKDTVITDVNLVLYIAMGIFAMTFLILTFVPFVEPEQEKSDATVKSLLKYSHLVYGVIAIFLYVGVEVGIPGTLNFYLTDTLGTANAATTAGFVAGTYWFLMLCGRFISSFISGKVSSRTQLTVTCAVAIALVISAMFLTEVQASMPVFTGSGFGMAQVPLTAVLLVLCGLCTSVMWGTIFNLSVEGLGRYSALASGLFMTMVVGGGVLPLLQGAIADSIGYVQSYWVIVAALAYMLWYAVAGSKVKKN